jgi:predicted transcriptional regulator
MVEFVKMNKDTRFTLRISSDLKKNLETIAAREGRSVAQICDAFLKAGSAIYDRTGPKFLQRFLSRQKK